MKIETELAQTGLCRDDKNGAISPPIYHSATFRHPEFGASTGYDYSRTSNPTRKILENSIASLEGGCAGFAFSSGMAAISTVMMLFQKGDRIILSDDLYGGTYRLMDKIFAKFAIESKYIDATRTQNIEKELDEFKPSAIFIETPSNPLMKICDIRKLSEMARKRGVLSVVDNTLMTPFLQRPLELGADIVLHSATKFLGGHNDVLAGLVAVKNHELAAKIAFLHNATGAVLSPNDSWLLMRGMKTLAIRMQRAQENACEIALWLSKQKEVEKIYYPNIEENNEYHLHKKQASGPGALLSFHLKDKKSATKIINNVKVFSFAESLGGVESLITYPLFQTHGDVPPETRRWLGITEGLLRISVGIESVSDLIDDLTQAFRS